MSETLLIWLFGGTWAVFGGWLVYLTKWNYAQSVLHQQTRYAIIAISKRAADILHHNDDRYRIDHLLDIYRDRMHEMSPAQWQELFDKCTEIAYDKTIAKDDRFAAGLIHDLGLFAREVAIHKLGPLAKL